MRAGELTSLVSYDVTQVRERRSPCLLPPTVCRRAGLGVTRAESCSCPSQAAARRRVGPAARLGDTLELTLLAVKEMNQSCRCENRRAAPAVSLICRMVAWKREICSNRPPTPLPTAAGGRAGLRSMRMEEATRSLTNCSNWESGLYTSPG